jgi:hypothetical protein
MAEKPKEYTVTGKYVTARTMTTDGWRVVGLMEGARVPPDADPEWIEHHLRKKLIAEVGKEPVAAADMDAEEAARYSDALVLAAEADIAKAEERLDAAKAQQRSAHERRDKAEAERAERENPKGAPAGAGAGRPSGAASAPAGAAGAGGKK